MFFWGKHDASNETLLLFFDSKVDEYNLFKTHVYILKKEQYSSFLLPFTTEQNKKYNNDKLQSWRNGEYITFPNPHDHIIWNSENSAILPDYARVNKSEIITSTHKRLSVDYLSQNYYDILFSSLDILHKEIISSKSYKEDFYKKLDNLKNSIQKAKDSFGENKHVKETLNPKDSYELFKKSNNVERALKELHFKTDATSNFSIIDSKLSNAYDFFLKDDLNKSFDLLKSIKNEIFSISLEKNDRDEFKEKIDYYFLLIKQKRDFLREEKNKVYQILLNEFSSVENFINNTTKWGEAFTMLKSFSNKIFSSNILREHKEDLKYKIDSLYKTLNFRKEKIEKEYLDECNSNYYRLNSSFSSVLSYNYCKNEELNQAIEITKSFKNSLKDTNPLKKEQRIELSDRVSFFLDLFYKRLKEYKEQKRNDWLTSQYQRIDKLNSIIDNKRTYISKLESVISSKENYMYTVKNENKKYEVGNEIRDIQYKIRGVEKEIQEIYDSIHSIRKKMEE